jgi:hypothetical protein
MLKFIPSARKLPSHFCVAAVALLAIYAYAAAPGQPSRGYEPGLGAANRYPHEVSAPELKVLAADPRLHLTLHAPVVVMKADGRQPALFCSAAGTLFCQAQLNARPFNTKHKIVYPVRIGTAISRDGGRTWVRWTHEENHDDVNMEGGMVQCADGTILVLDTYVVPGATPDHGVGELWKSHDDLRTLEGPFAVDFHLPTINWSGSTDDGGRPHASARLHRSLIELPNGDLLTTMYSWFAGDTAPAAYIASMKKTRVVIVRSRDHGASWSYLSTVGVDSGVGTEGFSEPVMVRVAHGPHAGRLVCLMRTGRDLYGSHSDDDGVTWVRPTPVRLPGIDIYATEKWAHLFGDPKAPGYMPTDDLIGTLVDPDLIQMANGTLVCAVGARIPAKEYKLNWHAPENGNYLAFSCDGGDTWSQVVQFLSGPPTTHYMGVREVAKDVLYVVYDDSVWRMPGEAMGFRLDVHRDADERRVQ